MLSELTLFSRSDIIQLQNASERQDNTNRVRLAALCWLPLTDIHPMFKITLVEIVIATLSNGILKIGVMVKVCKVCGILTLPTPVLRIIVVEVTAASIAIYASIQYFH